jgi:hypothetical protein
MTDGWIKLHRKLLGSCIFQNEKILKVFVWCLLKATHSDHEQIIGRSKINLEPGQFIFGRQKAAESLNISQSTVWEYMKLLEGDTTISIKSNNKYSVVTVVNWASYQLEEEDSDNKKTAEKQQTDNKSTTDGQQKDTNKNVKKGKNVKNGKKDIYSATQFNPPTIEDVKEYCLERNNDVDANKWHDFYSSKGWMVGKNKMKDWKAAVRTWEHKDNQDRQTKPQPNRPKSFDAIDDWDKQTEGLIL